MRTASDDVRDSTVEGSGVSGHLPERRCILTGATSPRELLLRLVPGPDGSVWPDLGARLPGRGAWISADRALLEEAIAKGRLKGALARAFKGPPPIVPADLPDRLAQMLERRALDRLGLEHRAGHLIFGTEKIMEWARAGRLFMLLHVADAAPDGARRLQQALRVGGGAADKIFWLPAGRDSLSRAVGRENMVHSGVIDGKAAARIAADVSRWTAYLGTKPFEEAGGGSDLADREGESGGAGWNDEGRE